jgi:CheY-like chemotaxis protein
LFDNLQTGHVPPGALSYGFRNGSHCTSGLKDVCILVVEDESLIRFMLVDELKEEGFDVCEAEDADQAIALIEQPREAFTLLVTDIHMPGLKNGLQVASLMRERHPHVPIVYATARPDALAGAGRLGPKDALLAKPFTPSELVTLVRQLLNG